MRPAASAASPCSPAAITAFALERARQGDVRRATDCIQEPLIVELAVEKMTLATLRQDPDTEAVEFPIADVRGITVWRKDIDMTLGDTAGRHGFLSLVCCTADTRTSLFRVSCMM